MRASRVRLSLRACARPSALLRSGAAVWCRLESWVGPGGGGDSVGGRRGRSGSPGIRALRQPSTGGGDGASLHYSFTVGKSGSGPWRHQVQGQLNEETFIICDSNNNCHDIDNLGKILSTTKFWETQIDTLKDGIDRLIDQALHMKQEINIIREPLSLQVKKCCWHEADGHSNASCDLNLNGHKVLYPHPSTGKWTEVDPGSMQIKEMWEKNKDLTDFLSRTSQGDCKAWLKEMIKLHLEEKLEPTGLVKDTAGIFTSASPTINPDVDQSSSMTMKPNPFVLLFTLALLVFL